MSKESNYKLNSILSTETNNVNINTNYLAIAKVIASKCLENGELKVGYSEAAILTLTNRYVDVLGDIAIIDRGRFKSILNKTLKATINVKRDLRDTNNLAELLSSDIGEVDYTKDVNTLVRLVLIVLFSGE